MNLRYLGRLGQIGAGCMAQRLGPASQCRPLADMFPAVGRSPPAVISVTVGRDVFDDRQVLRSRAQILA